jgi:exopolysaccharide biosynthesis polyprenyl glycosylphosphotransferase
MALRSARPTVVLGTGPLVDELLAEIAHRKRSAYRITGIITRERLDADAYRGYPVLGTLDQLHRVVLERRPKVIVVALPGSASIVEIQQLLDAKVSRQVRVEPAQTVYERLSGKVPIESSTAGEVIYSDDFEPRRISMLAARVLSFALALGGALALAPLLLLIAALIKLDSRGPALFVQERLGMGGRRFRLMKFRTMHPAQQRASEWENDNTHRITRVGKWLRKSRLDELPQFFNVLKGDMNIVGPRPHPACNFELFVLASRNMPESGLQIPYYTLRSSVRPGITGWAQVRYRYANNLDEELEKLRFDLYYLKHYSLWLDIRIMFETALMILARKPSATPDTAAEALPVMRPLAAREALVEPEPVRLAPVRERASDCSRL